MSKERRWKMVDREHPTLSIVRQCALLGVSLSGLYYRPKGASREEMDRETHFLDRDEGRPSRTG